MAHAPRVGVHPAQVEAAREVAGIDPDAGAGSELEQLRKDERKGGSIERGIVRGDLIWKEESGGGEAEGG